MSIDHDPRLNWGRGGKLSFAEAVKEETQGANLVATKTRSDEYPLER